jgi:long-chain acyl-CoA synthetase
VNHVQTLAGLFAWRVSESPEAEAYRQFDGAAGVWMGYTWAQTAARVDQWRAGLAQLRLARGDRVAILLPNGLEAVCVDQAALSLGLVPVPLHAIDNPGSIAYIVKDCDAAVLVLGTQEQWTGIAQVGEALPALKAVVTMAEGDAAPGPPAAIAVPVATSRAFLAAGVAPPAGSGPAPEDLAAIVYTSGTTGKPKGVMLTHRNVVANIESVLARVPAGRTDVFLSFLPLSHTFERTAGYYLPIAAGSRVAYVRSVAQIAEDLKTIRPTVLVSVPRIYERFYAVLGGTIERAGRVQRFLFQAAQNVGWRRFCRAQGLPIDSDGSSALLDALAWPLLRGLVARKVLAAFGGRIKVAVSGGAPMPQAVARCFLGLGLPLLQGYGMTETAPVVAANALDDNWPASVGRVLEGVQVRIGENRELQVHGANVMKGYWKRPEDTERVFTPDGWLRTGDQAAIEDGRIRILGRIKEIIVTSTGEKIAPGDLEMAITADPLFEQSFVIGDNRPFIAAFVVVNAELWARLAQELGVDPADSAGLNSEAVRHAVLQRIRAATRSFPSYAVPRAVWISREPWSLQNGMMTPTLKLKRNALNEHFAGAIATLYQRSSN